MSTDMMPRSRFVALPGRRLHVLEWGNIGAPVLLLVHGMRDHAHSWDWLAAGLAETFHILAPDLRGHGDSEWAAAYNIPDYVSELAELVAALDASPASLVGHSLGGHIAVRYAACFPESVTCLCSIEGVELPIIREQRRAPRSYPARLRAWIEGQAVLATRKPRHYATLAKAQAHMSAAHPTIAPDMIAHLTLHGVIEDPGIGLRWKYDNAARLRAPEDASGVELDQTLAGIACSTLLAFGDQSWIELPSPQRLSHIRSHRALQFPDASQWLHLQSRPAFLAALSNFLDSPAAFIQNESPLHA